MATTAIYNIVCWLNHPVLTENSPITIAAIKLKGVFKVLGVLIAANFNPSTANSKINSCQKIGTYSGFSILVNINQSGKISGLFA